MFELINTKKGVMQVSVTENGVTFNRTVTEELEEPEYVQIAIDKEEKKLALKVCQKEDKYSVRYKAIGNTQNVRMNSIALKNAVAGMMEWNLNLYAYRAYGRIEPDGEGNEIAVFYLKEAKEM